MVYTRCPKASLFIFGCLPEVKTINCMVEWGKAGRLPLRYGEQNHHISTMMPQTSEVMVRILNLKVSNP